MATTIGLPQIDIEFKTLAATAIQRSARGIVALILNANAQEKIKEGENNGPIKQRIYSYSNLAEVKNIMNSDQAGDTKDEEWEEDNYNFIKQAFAGAPSKVMVYKKTKDVSIDEALNYLKSEKWNWIAAPGANSQDTDILISWIKDKREKNNFCFKAVVADPSTSPDHEAIVNFATHDIKIKEKTYTASQFTARIAGILAGLPLTRSATYFVLDEVESISGSENPEEDIKKGKMILINDGVKIKIARGVNSYANPTPEKHEAFCKIKIIEGMDIIKEDITTTFANYYIGKYLNNYDNKTLFMIAVNLYLQDLTGTVLDPAGENRVDVDMQEHIDYMLMNGISTEDISKMSEYEIRSANTGDKVLAVIGEARFLDAMENLKIKISL